MNNTGNELQCNFVVCSRNVYTSSAIHTQPPTTIFHGNPPCGSREQTDMTVVIGASRHYENAPINYMSTLLAQLSNVWLAVLVMEPISSLFLEHHKSPQFQYRLN